MASFGRALSSPLRGSNGAPTYYTDVALAAARAFLKNADIPQQKLMFSAPDETYRRFTTLKGLSPRVQTFPSAADSKEGVGPFGFWLGNPKATRIILYIHGMRMKREANTSLANRLADPERSLGGGGYVLPITSGHFEYVSDLLDALRSRGHDVAAMVGTYTYAPTAHYPQQNIEGAQMLKYLLEEEGRSPSDVSIPCLRASGFLGPPLLSSELQRLAF